jgi:hypothetical protein
VNSDSTTTEKSTRNKPRNPTANPPPTKGVTDPVNGRSMQPNTPQATSEPSPPPEKGVVDPVNGRRSQPNTPHVNPAAIELPTVYDDPITEGDPIRED